MKPTLDFSDDRSLDHHSGGRIFASSTPVERPPQAGSGDHKDGEINSRSSLEAVKAYYGGRTEHILRRYGPGPRVHYHTGMVDELEDLQMPAQVLRRRLVASQERILAHAAEVWRAASNLSGEVLDVGCGLGGGSLFWAQEFGAHVTAVTLVPEHVKRVEQFAASVGVGSRVRPLVANVLQLEGHDYFDAAVAFDASCHLPRQEWFRRLNTLLRPGGRVFISDCFLGRRENQVYEDTFNAYWHARIGTVDEYIAAANEADLELGGIEDLSSRVADFFSITRALIDVESEEESSKAAEVARLTASFCEHTIMLQGLRDRGYVYAQLSFVKNK